MVAGKLKAYKITLTSVAEGTYRKFVEAAADPIDRGELGHAAVKRMRLVDECLDVIIPHERSPQTERWWGICPIFFASKKGGYASATLRLRPSLKF